ncbi:2OG-Fe(II) oxygenase [Amphritea sp. 1_MG-2023]|uniref:2OG-Fe(II) oxygenase n=1 Tax=Amphritea sp. 1_MG-2023 TaxID=3062670 RepID=UPI0026E30402|nr:2OG-Fe(II) oxygenase [Amphritea sp. 1_MG-2023]MDO6563072.1 2OG-Fe(II) oxygenase [Amphritea sp. 1_MG-2023]
MTSPDVFEQIAEALYQQGYAVLSHALPEPLCRALAQEVRHLPAEQFSRAGVGRQDDHVKADTIRRDEICWIDNNTAAGREWLRWAGELQQAINRRLFLGLFSFESHYAHYQAGDFYKKHRDAFRGQQNRVLSVVTYLNTDWQPEDGGELLIYPDNGDVPLLRVIPEFGTLVVFLSEEFPHEVLPAQTDRYSIAGWFRINSGNSQRIDPDS